MRLLKLSENLTQKRAYAFDSRNLKSKKIKNFIKFFKNNGFCLLDNVIPQNKIKAIREEILNAQSKSSQNIDNIKKILMKKKN